MNVVQRYYAVWLRIRAWLMELASTAFLANLMFDIGLSQACMLAERKVPAAARVVPYTTKFGVCYYSRGEHWVLANALYIMTGLFVAVALLHFAAKPVRGGFDVVKKQFVMQRELGPQSTLRSAAFLVAFLLILAWICWG